MEYRDNRDMKKLSLGTILALCWITRFVGFGVAAGGLAFLDYNLPAVTAIMAGIGIVIFIASVFIEVIYYVCPHCGGGINSRHLPYGYCRHCGKPLTENHEDTEE